MGLVSDREYPRRTAPPGTQRARPRTAAASVQLGWTSAAQRL